MYAKPCCWVIFVPFLANDASYFDSWVSLCACLWYDVGNCLNLCSCFFAIIILVTPYFKQVVVHLLWDVMFFLVLVVVLEFWLGGKKRTIFGFWFFFSTAIFLCYGGYWNRKHLVELLVHPLIEEVSTTILITLLFVCEGNTNTKLLVKI